MVNAGKETGIGVDVYRLKAGLRWPRAGLPYRSQRWVTLKHQTILLSGS
jgi:hypothetical protein